MAGFICSKTKAWPPPNKAKAEPWNGRGDLGGSPAGEGLGQPLAPSRIAGKAIGYPWRGPRGPRAPGS
jgi:hypothetical protein